jgi:hypothetical protein
MCIDAHYLAAVARNIMGHLLAFITQAVNTLNGNQVQFFKM